jgi:DNA invertase Pin-like site-specific DNA recombinase
MLDQLRNGDTVIVWKLDRLARSTRDLLETMETIREAGAPPSVAVRALGQHGL